MNRNWQVWLAASALLATPAWAEETETATFSMYCCWTGEATLSQLQPENSRGLAAGHPREYWQGRREPAFGSEESLISAGSEHEERYD